MTKRFWRYFVTENRGIWLKPRTKLNHNVASDAAGLKFIVSSDGNTPLLCSSGQRLFFVNLGGTAVFPSHIMGRIFYF